MLRTTSRVIAIVALTFHHAPGRLRAGPCHRDPRTGLALVAPRQSGRRPGPHAGGAMLEGGGSAGSGVGVVPGAGRLRRHRHPLRDLRQHLQPVRPEHPRRGLGADAQAHEARGGLRSVRDPERRRRRRDLLRGRRPVRLRPRLEGHTGRGRRDAAIARSGAVGGISAGLAILGQFLFAAEKDTIQSGQALADCYAKKITLERDLLDVPVWTPRSPTRTSRSALDGRC